MSDCLKLLQSRRTKIRSFEMLNLDSSPGYKIWIVWKRNLPNPLTQHLTLNKEASKNSKHPSHAVLKFSKLTFPSKVASALLIYSNDLISSSFDYVYCLVALLTTLIIINHLCSIASWRSNSLCNKSPQNIWVRDVAICILALFQPLKFRLPTTVHTPGS